MKPLSYPCILYMVFSLAAIGCGQTLSGLQNFAPSFPRICQEDSQDDDMQWFVLDKNEEERWFRVDGIRPFYEYIYDETGELFLTLYYNEETRQGRGISYGYGANHNKIGFVFNRFEEAEWVEPDLYTWDGAPGKSTDLKLVEENRDYDEHGRLIHYEYTGDVTEWYDSYSHIMPRITFQIEYDYRDDGSLWRKTGHYDGREYDIPSDDKTSYFDGLGRETFSKEYITHGSLQKYYIYESDARKPKYCFVFDSGWEVYMIQYREH